MRQHDGVPEIPPLPESTILLVEVGSTAHGTGLPGGEDHDEMGVVVERPQDVVGLNERGYRTVMQRTQPEGTRSGPGDTDRTLHSLRRFLRLAVSGSCVPAARIVFEPRREAVVQPARASPPRPAHGGHDLRARVVLLRHERVR